MPPTPGAGSPTKSSPGKGQGQGEASWSLMAPGPLRGANPKGLRPPPASSRDPAGGGRRAPSARQRRSLQDGACQGNSTRLQIWLTEGVVDTIIADAGLALPDVRRKHTRRAKSARECFHADEELAAGGSLEVAVNERALLGGLQRGPLGSPVLPAPCCGQRRRKRRGGRPWQRALKVLLQGFVLLRQASGTWMILKGTRGRLCFVEGHGLWFVQG